MFSSVHIHVHVKSIHAHVRPVKRKNVKTQKRGSEGKGGAANEGVGLIMNIPGLTTCVYHNIPLKFKLCTRSI